MARVLYEKELQRGLGAAGCISKPIWIGGPWSRSLLEVQPFSGIPPPSKEALVMMGALKCQWLFHPLLDPPLISPNGSVFPIPKKVDKARLIVITGG